MDEIVVDNSELGRKACKISRELSRTISFIKQLPSDNMQKEKKERQDKIYNA